MNFKDYENAALETSPQICPSRTLLHGALGVGTEAGELLDICKRKIYHDVEVDRFAVIEECGDVLWYLVQALRAVDATLEDAAMSNVSKLRARYPDGYSHERSKTRDLEAERRAARGKSGDR